MASGLSLTFVRIAMSKGIRIAIVSAVVVLLAAGATVFFHSQKPARHFQQRKPPEVVGIGVALRINQRTHDLLVMDVISNTPAAEAGITNGLIISKVDDVPMHGMELTNCANLIRGPVGSTVKLELITPDHNQTNVAELTRRKIKY